MPLDFLSKGVAEIPDIGEPTNACFFTMSNIDPAGWWEPCGVLCYVDWQTMLKQGGFLKSLMGWGAFGILSKRHSILEVGADSISQTRLSTACHQISSWTESYGTISSPLPQHYYTKPTHLVPFVPRFGESTFQEAMKIAHRTEGPKINWAEFRYMVFDVPNYHVTYEQRYAKLRAYFKLSSLLQLLLN